MKLKLALLAVCCLLSAAVADDLWGDEPPRSRASVYALEGLGAIGGVVGCGGLGAGALALVQIAAWQNAMSIIFSPDHGPGDQTLMVLGSLTAIVSGAALPAVAGCGAARAGEELGGCGSPALAVGGAYVGAAVGAGLAWLGSEVSRSNAVRIPAYVLCGLAVPVGAVVGYNLGAPSNSIGGRLRAPGLALTSVELPDRSVEYGVKVQLAGLRF